jgi:hypothetical protein
MITNKKGLSANDSGMQPVPAIARANTVNAALRKLHPNLKLLGGRGYQYFTFDAPGVFETRSVYVYRISDLTLAQWLEEARSFLLSLHGMALAQGERDNAAHPDAAGPFPIA